MRHGPTPKTKKMAHEGNFQLQLGRRERERADPEHFDKTEPEKVKNVLNKIDHKT